MQPLRTINNYTKELVNLSKSALVEVMTALLQYSDRMVLGGGWAPFFILEKYGIEGSNHCGSIDIDFILDPIIVKEPYISEIAHLLEFNNFHKLPEDPFPFRFAPPLKTGSDINIDYPMHIEFISEETETKQDLPRIQPKLMISRFKGIQFALKNNFNHTITANVKEHLVTIQLKILDSLGSLVLKALSLESRYKEKDAYDIYMVIKYHKNPLIINQKLKQMKNDSTVKEAIRILQKKFETRDSDGPFFVSEFLITLNQEEKEKIKTDAFMRVNQILEGV